MMKQFLAILTCAFLIVSGAAGISLSDDAPNNPNTWSPPLRIDQLGQSLEPFSGGYPTVSYSPQGDLRIFYQIDRRDVPFAERTLQRPMLVRARMADQTDFADETFVYEYLRTATLHYGNDGSIDLAAEDATFANILKSADNGQTWRTVRNPETFDTIRYWAADESEAYEQVVLTDDDGLLRLFYGIEKWAVLGPYPAIRHVKMTEDGWPIDRGHPSLPGYESPFINRSRFINAFEKDDHVVIVGTGKDDEGIVRSADNLQTLQSVTDLMPAFINEASMDENGRIHIIGKDRGQNIYHAYSDDFFATWSEPQQLIIDPGQRRSRPQITASGNNVLVLWRHGDSLYEAHQINGIISRDRGQTWGPVENIVTIDNPEVIIPDIEEFESLPLGLSSFDGKFALAYYLCADAQCEEPEGVYLTEWEPSQEGTFLRGDADSSGTLEISDAISILYYLFLNGNTSCQDALDVDDSGNIDLTDAIGLLNFLFINGPSPRAPFPEIGPDPTADSLTCGM